MPSIEHSAVYIDNLDSIAVLVLCVAGFIVGWRKIIPGLVLFIAVNAISHIKEFAVQLMDRHGASIDTMTDEQALAFLKGTDPFMGLISYADFQEIVKAEAVDIFGNDVAILLFLVICGFLLKKAIGMFKKPAVQFK